MEFNALVVDKDEEKNTFVKREIVTNLEKKIICHHMKGLFH